eukprot:scaffold2462_cov402-Prasinococcus_capsulatus_cf.AAC.27
MAPALWRRRAGPLHTSDAPAAAGGRAEGRGAWTRDAAAAAGGRRRPRLRPLGPRAAGKWRGGPPCGVGRGAGLRCAALRPPGDDDDDDRGRGRQRAGCGVLMPAHAPPRRGPVG